MDSFGGALISLAVVVRDVGDDLEEIKDYLKVHVGIPGSEPLRTEGIDEGLVNVTGQGTGIAFYRVSESLQVVMVVDISPSAQLLDSLLPVCRNWN